MINLDDKKSEGAYWVSLFIDRNLVVYFDSFEIEYMPLEVLNEIKRSITQNIFRIQECMNFVVSLSWNICLQENFVR